MTAQATELIYGRPESEWDELVPAWISWWSAPGLGSRTTRT
jgi:hypothetical protein